MPNYGNGTIAFETIVTSGQPFSSRYTLHGKCLFLNYKGQEIERHPLFLKL